MSFENTPGTLFQPHSRHSLFRQHAIRGCMCGESARRLSGECSPFNMAPRPLAKPPVSSSLGDEVPHIFIRESNQRPRKILITVENDFCNKIGTWPTRSVVRFHGEYWRVSGPSLNIANLVL